MKGKDELEGTRRNFTPWLRDFEHQGENCLGGCCNPPLGELGLMMLSLTLEIFLIAPHLNILTHFYIHVINGAGCVATFVSIMALLSNPK